MALLERRARRTAVVGAMLALASAGMLAAGCDSCQGRSSPGVAVDAGLDGATTGTSAEPADDEDGSAASELLEAGNRFRDARPLAAADPDGPTDPACVGGKGAEIALASAVVDPRCAIGRVRARQLRALLERDGGPPVSLRQEAKLLEDGRIVHRLVNVGPAALTLPLIFSVSLPAFLVMAEDEGQTLYELAAPRFDASAPATKGRAHFARIVLEPGGAAGATITLDPTIASVVARRGGDRADAGAAKLPKGHYVLRIGELLADVEAGAPARLPFDVH
jgi:hypothetical protein